MYILIRWIFNALALWLTAQLGVGLYFTQTGLVPVLVATLILGLVNAVVRPVMILLTLPLTILTLGLFLLVVNALSIAIVAALTPLAITGFWGAVFGALILTVISSLLSALVGENRRSATEDWR